MKLGQKHCFYLILVIYGVYNVLWMCGVMFSFGKNDMQMEILYFVLTFLVDIPVFLWLATRRLDVGAIFFLSLLIAGMLIAATLRILNAQTLTYWYSPKILPFAMAIWINRSRVEGKM